jgi:hypothetical protein
MSMHLAFFAHKNCFDAIYKVAIDSQCKVSVWVDDIIISGKNSKFVVEKVKILIKKSGLEYHYGEKFKIYKPNDNKEITGVVLTPAGGLKVRNRTQKAIYELKNKRDRGSKEQNKLDGLVNYAKQIIKNCKVDS